MHPEETDWTVLLIGGTSATGKTTLAEHLALHFDARYIDTDLFWIVLKSAVPREVAPNLHAFEQEDSWIQPVDELIERYLGVAAYLCKSLEQLVAHHSMIGRRVVMEGVWLLPSFAAQGNYAGVAVPDVRAVYVHEADASEIERRIEERPARGMQRHSQEARNHIAMQHRFGEELRRRAEALRYPVVESRPFETLFHRTLKALGARA